MNSSLGHSLTGGKKSEVSLLNRQSDMNLTQDELRAKYGYTGFRARKFRLRARSNKNQNGKFTIGSRAQVFHGTAIKTSGGLTQPDLIKNKWGRIVSRRKHLEGKSLPSSHPFRQFFARKGEFGTHPNFCKNSSTRKWKQGRRSIGKKTCSTGKSLRRTSSVVDGNRYNLRSTMSPRYSLRSVKNKKSSLKRGGMGSGGPLSPETF